MKILFVCGCLESGKDGVGDYTRALAQKLVTLDCECAIVALNDSYVTVTTNSIIKIENFKICELRIPSREKSRVRYNITKNYIYTFSPDIISLQFVPYSFQKKGLPISLIPFLKAIKNKGTLSIMFHELWLDNPANFKANVYQFLQKKIIGLLTCKQKQSIINVTIDFNKERLRKLKVNSSILPLFGNISKQLCTKKYSSWSNFEEKKIKILYFGAHPRDEFRSLLIDKLYEFCVEKKGEIAIVCACGSSNSRHQFINLMKDKLMPLNVHIEDTGYLSIEEIDFLMDNCTVGISRSIPHLLGKSGSSIAMLEHGLPVWLPKAIESEINGLNFHFRNELLIKDLFQIDGNFCLRKEYHSQIQSVAIEFMNQFNID